MLQNPRFTTRPRALTRTLALVLAAGLTLPLAACSTSDEDTVNLMMDVGYLPKHALFLGAAAEGFFAEEGLTLELMPGSGSNNTVTSVETGRTYAGFADFGVTVMNQGRGAEVKQVNLLQATSAYAVVTDSESGISDWEDLKGKTVATEGAGAMTSMWPYALGQLGFDKNDVHVVHASSASKIPGLLAGQWDANLAMSVSDVPAVKALGLEPVSLNWADIGISIYGNGIVMADAELASDPEKARRFNRALQRGFLWACAHPAETYAAFDREVQGYTRETVDLAISEQCALNWAGNDPQEVYGQMNDAGIQAVIDIAHEFLGLDPATNLPPTQVYTNEFITPITQADLPLVSTAGAGN